MAKRKSTFFETKYFGLVIGALVFGILVLIGATSSLLDRVELRTLDVHFSLKNAFQRQTVQEGVTEIHRDPRISPDILILGVDFQTLSQFGKWPFPRYRHADLIDSFSRIKDQGLRERALFLDFFFIEPAENAYNDALLVDSIKNNGRVFLETVLEANPPPPGLAQELFSRHDVLFDNVGEITNVKGDWQDMPYHLGLQPPLKPYGRATHGYGHANFYEDYDEVYRHQPLVAKSTELLETIRLDQLSVNTKVDTEHFERLVWFDRDGREHNIPTPLTAASLKEVTSQVEARAPQRADDTNNDGQPDDFYYIIRRYKDHFIPAITLSLALDYFHKTFADAEVVIGDHIRIANPEYFDVNSQQWVPYRIEVTPPQFDAQGNVTKEGVYRDVPEINIPIDDNGNMLINFMGPRSSAARDGAQTFPVRPYSGYAARVPGPDPASWPRTRAVENKILMAGAFAAGMAADEKTTPYGLMYGVEIHANALNTIIMDNFLHYAPAWMNLLILAAAALLTAFMSSRLSTIWSLLVALVVLVVYFFTVTLIFDQDSFILNFTSPALAIILTFLGVVVYRVMTEERDKRRIRDMFGKYVSPRVVDQILDNPPELGGVDKELSVFFSDIRGFTTLSESMTPQDLVNHLNVYLTAMTDVILEYRGTLDKYVGDEIMCFWGAPLPQPDHAILACKCAVRQMEVLNELNTQWPEEKRINIGIGINSGIMTVGNMGSLGRMNYTLTGDNVNLGARLEGTNKMYGTNVIMSEYTYGLVKERVIARELDNIRVKGKNRPVQIYELIDIPEGLEAPQPDAEKHKA